MFQEPAAYRVVDYLYLHPLSGLGYEDVGNLVAESVVLEDVILEVDGAAPLRRSALRASNLSRPSVKMRALLLSVKG